MTDCVGFPYNMCPRSRRLAIWRSIRMRDALLPVAAFMVAIVASIAAHADSSSAQRITLPEVDSWAYQLQGVRPVRIATDAFDLLVIDYSADGSDAKRYTSKQIATLRKRPPLKDRIVLAYLSIGEAEDYRLYWKSEWMSDVPNEAAKPAEATLSSKSDAAVPDPGGKSAATTPLDRPRRQLSSKAPDWLAAENPEWPGNFLVKYWDPAWKSMIFGSPTALLDKIMAAGFDGVYLDKTDSNDDWKKTRPTAEREMVEFVKEIASYARVRKPGFLVVPQNGESLLVHDDYLNVIDGIGKEDLLFGGDTRKDGEPNPEKEIAESVAAMLRLKTMKKPVLAVEYLKNDEQIAKAVDRLLGYGFIPFIAERQLEEEPVPIEERIDSYETFLSSHAK